MEKIIYNNLETLNIIRHMNQIKMDRYFMDVAVRTAELSHAIKKKVGCVLVKDNRIISVGYNSTPAGFDNNCEYYDENNDLKTKPEVIHAEMNAIVWCAKVGINTEGASCFISLSPCKNCALILIQSGIKRVVYLEDYWNPGKDGLDLLRMSGIKVEKLEP